MTPKAEYIFHPMDDVKNDSLLNIYIAVRYSDLSTLKYLPLDMEFASLDNDSIKNLKIKVPMFDDKNSNEGKGSFGIYETRCLSLQTKKEEGFYISLSTPETDTRGILSLGVICESQNHNP